MREGFEVSDSEIMAFLIGLTIVGPIASAALIAWLESRW